MTALPMLETAIPRVAETLDSAAKSPIGQQLTDLAGRGVHALTNLYNQAACLIANLSTNPLNILNAGGDNPPPPLESTVQTSGDTDPGRMLLGLALIALPLVGIGGVLIAGRKGQNSQPLEPYFPGMTEMKRMKQK